MTKRKEFIGRLPTGRDTADKKLYVKEWEQFNNKVQEALVCQVIGFDPGVLCREQETDLIYNLPLPVASRIVYLWEKAFDKQAAVC